MTRLGNEQWYPVREVALIMGCSYDTARQRMEEMPDCINVGSQKRRQLMVPQSSLESWFRNHRIRQEKPEVKIPVCRDGKMARIDRRTGKLKAV